MTLKSVLIVIVLGACSTPSAAVPPAGKNVFVEWVYDGDTIRVVETDKRRIKVRVRGIDCPESRHNEKCEREGKRGLPNCAQQIPMGKKAKKRALELLFKKRVSLVCEDKCQTDKYGRALRYVHLQDGRDFGLLMIREGLCQDLSHKFPHPRSASYR
jgi:micrococcal nuclease